MDLLGRIAKSLEELVEQQKKPKRTTKKKPDEPSIGK